MLPLPACKRTVHALLQRQYPVQTSTHCSEIGGDGSQDMACWQRKMGSKASDTSGLVPPILAALQPQIPYRMSGEQRCLDSSGNTGAEPHERRGQKRVCKAAVAHWRHWQGV